MSTKIQGRHGHGASVKKYLPIFQWLPAYQKSWLRSDVIAALTVWALLVPQAMAYATLAGVPPQAGLYAVPLAILGYAIFGTSRQLSIGPGATMAVMAALVVGTVAGGDPEQYIQLSAMLALLVGGILFVSGLVRLGVLADFVSKPILKGFIVGIAMTIVVSQLSKLLGYDVPDSGFFRELWYFIRDLHMTHGSTLAVGLSSLAALFLLHRLAPKIPAAMAVVAVAILASTVLGLEKYGVGIVGDIPAGLPPIGFPLDISASDILGLLPGAIAVALVGFMESIAPARTYASKHKYEVNSNRELMGLGAANLGAGFSQGFVVDCSISRSAANDQAGARTQMASLITAVMVVITLVALSPLFHNLPYATLGAIVIFAVWSLIDFKEMKRLYRVKRSDFWPAMVALLGVLTVGILAGLAFAVLLSILGLLWRARTPPTAILGKVPGEDVYRNIENYPDSETFPGLIIFRFDGSLFFANAPSFLEQVRLAVAADPSARSVLVDAESINDIDATALDMLKELRNELDQSGVGLRFARMKTSVLESLRRASLEDAIGADHFYLSVRAGVDAFRKEIREDQTTPDST